MDIDNRQSTQYNESMTKGVLRTIGYTLQWLFIIAFAVGFLYVIIFL